MPETLYTRSGNVNIAYQVVGDGPTDFVYVPGWVSNVELMWDDPGFARFLRRLSSFARLITFDKRGTGLSDPVPLDNLPDFDTRMDDLRAVMDAAGSRSATIFGHSEGAPFRSSSPRPIPNERMGSSSPAPMRNASGPTTTHGRQPPKSALGKSNTSRRPGGRPTGWKRRRPVGRTIPRSRRGSAAT